MFLMTFLYQLVICALFHNEELFIKEWIEHHRTLGVEHFYLYDHESTDSSRALLAPYIREGLVDLFDWPAQIRNMEEYRKNLQLPVYNHALALAKESSLWAAFIDLDEFLVPHSADSLPLFLQEYLPYGGLAVNWQLFGTSSLEQLPENASLRASLIQKASFDIGRNQWVKLIVQPRLVRAIRDPHTFEMQEGASIVTSNHTPLRVKQRCTPVQIDRIQLNHYWFGTKNWFYEKKLPRLLQWGYQFTPETLEETIFSYNTHFDTSICRFVVPNKETL
ncbi:MAG: glycosyltransferase family 92 protein [Verrucomicrobiota bacterium]|nr:glycosyltransferase family 92 protein [Verrucomicrobiota bacterium]